MHVLVGTDTVVVSAPRKRVRNVDPAAQIAMRNWPINRPYPRYPDTCMHTVPRSALSPE